MEHRLNVRLPNDVRQLLRESNGGDCFGGGHHVRVWNCQQIEAQNAALSRLRFLALAEELGKDLRYGLSLDHRAVCVALQSQARVTSLAFATFSDFLLQQHLDAMNLAFGAYIARREPPTIELLLESLPTWRRAPGVNADELACLARDWPFPLPHDYQAAMRWSDGFDCAAGTRYISLERGHRLQELNAAYRVPERLPRIVMIGTDGGDNGVGFFSPEEGSVVFVSFDLGSMAPDEVRVWGPNLLSCLLLWSGTHDAALCGGRLRLLRLLTGRVS